MLCMMPTASGGISIPYSDGTGIVSRIATESGHPFLFNGKTVANENVRRRYGETVKKFSSVLDCLKPSERSKAQPELLNIAWNLFTSTQEADVCLFRVAASYRTKDDFANWLKKQDFKVHTVIDNRITGNEEAWISASRSTKEHGALFYSSILQRLGIMGADWSLSLLARFDHAGQVVGMKVVFNTK